MIYDLVLNTLQRLNPNALPLDDLAALEMPKMLNWASTYVKGFINRYDFEKAICSIMGYDANECISGFLVRRAYEDIDGEVHSEVLDVYDTFEDAEKALAEYKSIDNDSKYGYAICERR